jgi:MFS family permease
MKKEIGDKTYPEKFMYRNIIIFYINSALMWGRFFIPVLALFYIASQVTFAQFSIIMSVFALSTLLLEIPTGVLADIIGKKKTLLLSRAMYLIEVLILAFFNGFWPFLIAKIISGIGVSLSSGTGSAMVYDSLKKMKKEEDYKIVAGKGAFIGYLSMAFVFIIGAYLFSINPKLPAKISLIPLTIGFVITFFLTEPFNPRTKLTLINSFKHLKKGLSKFWNTKILIYFALLTLLIESATNMMLSYSSVYLDKILIPIYFIGAVNFISSIILALSSKKAHFFELKFPKSSLVILCGLTFIGIFLMSFMTPYIGVLFYLILPFVLGLFGIIISDAVNKRVSSKNRATMLSINNMFYSLGAFVFFPILGFLEKSNSLSFALFAFSILLLVSFIFLQLFKNKIERITKLKKS